MTALFRRTGLKLSEESADWPCEFAGAQRVRTPNSEGDSRSRQFHTRRIQSGVLVAEADLEAHGIQELADQIPAITQAAIGTEIKFKIRVEFGGETPDPIRRRWKRLTSSSAEVDGTLRLK